jgi:hypothetical protein
MLEVVHDADASNENGTAGGSLLDEIVRDGARAMLAAALQAEVAAYIDAHHVAGPKNVQAQGDTVRHRYRNILLDDDAGPCGSSPHVAPTPNAAVLAATHTE